MATPIRPAAAAPPARPPQPLPPPPHHDTTLTLALALPPPPPPFARGVAPRPAPRPPDVVVASRPVRPSPPAGGTPPPPCSECGKRFSSWKALFGHMRCHPERQWRGMTPPPHFWHQFTVQERETATSLLMLRRERPAGAGSRGKKSILGAAGTSASSPLPRCDDHKCSVCARGFATGRALGGHKRCHWEKTEGAPAVATCSGGGCSASATSSSQAAPATTLDLNLPPLPRKSDQGGSLDATLDLKLGF